MEETEDEPCKQLLPYSLLPLPSKIPECVIRKRGKVKSPNAFAFGIFES